MLPVFHFLDAGGKLTDFQHWLRAILTGAFERAAPLLPLKPLDVVVQAGAFVIPEKGHVGYAPRCDVVFVTVDPLNPALITNQDCSLERMFVHELHHCARWTGPGYGLTLGQALVSEGLACQFTREIYGNPPEPWEEINVPEAGSHVLRADQDWDNDRYGHHAWFYGNDTLPRWLGYSLGSRLVGAYLSRNAGTKPSNLWNEGADSFRGYLPLVQSL